jgi:predicted phosphate transport protein (TIGR00153 family)
MVLARFLPRDEQFFQHFQDGASNAAETAGLLADIIGNGEDTDRKVRRLRDLEHHGDEITHRIFSALNSTFVTPLDREDIRDLAGEIDDFVDDLEEVGRRIALYKLGPSREPAKLFARILEEQANIIVDAVKVLELAAKQHEAIRRSVLEIHRLENEADDALNQTMADLYDGVTDVPALIQAIRWGELYALLEDATDSAEAIANTLEGILLKHA